MPELSSDNLLVRHPWLYESIYPEAAADTIIVCEKIIDRFMPGDRWKILDAGCGTGRILGRLMQLGHQGFGIDISKSMVEYARSAHPGLRVEQGDMRDFNLEEQFDIITCTGSTFTQNVSDRQEKQEGKLTEFAGSLVTPSNKDVHSTLSNFRSHLRDEGILVLDMLNASRFLSSEVFNERIETRVDEGEFHATAVSRHLLDRRRQSFKRIRTWIIEGQGAPVVDDTEYRLFFPLEIEDYLAQHRFQLLGMWDNKELEDSDFSGRRLYIATQAI